jgi:hypothetical protein
VFANAIAGREAIDVPESFKRFAQEKWGMAEAAQSPLHLSTTCAHRICTALDKMRGDTWAIRCFD